MVVPNAGTVWRLPGTVLPESKSAASAIGHITLDEEANRTAQYGKSIRWVGRGGSWKRGYGSRTEDHPKGVEEPPDPKVRVPALDPTGGGDQMGWFILAQVFSILIAIVSLGRLSEREKDLEILVLRQQLAILKRKQGQPVKPNRAEKMTLALLTAKLKEVTQRPASRLRDTRISPIKDQGGHNWQVFFAL
jgi:hypothetical protein